MKGGQIMIKNWLMKYSWVVWVGASLGFLYDSSLADWQFWVFLFVIALLVALHDYSIINEYKKGERRYGV